ncbi:MAG: autotransporter-associated beta strand repeat-containing protein [Thermoguttaceae bacterium]|nr:autotransporter-associated beta strand repeat-containing protein [Thermoguttaceae bacterium]
MTVSQFRVFSIRRAIVTLSVLFVCIFALTSSVQADMVVFWNFDQSYNDGTDYVIDSVTSERLNLVNSSIVDGKLTANGGYAQGTGTNNGLNATLPTGTSNYTLSAFLSTTRNGAVGMISWGVRGSTRQTNSFRTEKNGIDNYWWGDDLAVTGYPEVISGFENHAVATGAGRTQTLYLNGQLIGSRDAKGDRNEENRSFFVGNTINNNTETLYGSIDNASVYNEALEQSEIINIAAHTYSGLTNYWKSGDRVDRVSGAIKPDTVTGAGVVTGDTGTMVFNRELQAGERAYYQGQLASGHGYVIDNMASSESAKTTWLRAASGNLSDAGQTPLGIYVGGTTTVSTLTATPAQLNAVNHTLILGGGALELNASGDAVIDTNRVDFNSAILNLTGSGKVTVNSTNQMTFRNVTIADGTALELKTDNNLAFYGAITGSGDLIKTGSGDMLLDSAGNLSYAGTVRVNGGTMTFHVQDVWGNADQVHNNSYVIDNAIVTNDAAVFNNMRDATFRNGAKIVAANGNPDWKAFMLTGTTTIDFSGDGNAAENPVIFEVASTATGDARTNATICPYNNTFNVADITKSADADLIVTAVLASTPNNGSRVGKFTKTGDGTMKLTAANTYTGGTTLQAGEIIAANDSALGTGAVTIEDGVLTLGENASAAQHLAFNGALTISGGQINFDFVNAGSGQFDNINTGSGALNISGGTFNVNFADGAEETWFNNAGNGYALITSNGASFAGDLTDSLSGVSSDYGWKLKSSTSGLYLYGKIVSDYYKVTSATTTDDVVTGNVANEYLGVQFDETTSPSATEATNTGWVTMNDMDGTFNIGEGYKLTQQGLVTGTKGLSKEGAGTLVIDRENDYQGGTAIGEGTLVLTDNGTLGTATKVGNAGTFEINNNNDRTFSLNISGDGDVVKSGTGTLTLNVPNTFTGDMDITQGTVVMAYNAGGAGVSKTATVLGDPSVEGRKITVHSGATLTTESSANGIDVFGGADAYPKFTIVADGGTIATSSNQLTTYGDIELKNGGVFEDRGGHMNSSTSANGWYTIFNGKISVTSGNAEIRSTSNGKGISMLGYRDGVATGTTFDVAKDSTLTVSAILKDCVNYGKACSFTKTGEGTMELTNNTNTYTGNIVVDEGKLIAKTKWAGTSTTVFGKYQAKTVTVNKNGELVLAAQDVVSDSSHSTPIQFIVNGGKISNSGTVYNNLNNTVFTDGAELYASDGNSPWKAYKLSTTVSVLRNADGSAAQPVKFTSDPSKPNATYSFGKGTRVIVDDVTSESADEVDTLSDLVVSGLFTIPNTESGCSFYKEGKGTMEFTAANTIDGTVGIREGVLRLTGDGALGTAVVQMDAGATLEFSVDEEKRFGNTIEGSGNLLKTGAGVLYLNGTETNPISAAEFDVEAGDLMFNGDYTGNLIVYDGALLSPGNSVGTLNVTGGVTFDDGSTLLIEQDETGIDVLNATTLDFADGAIIDIASTAFQPDSEFAILTQTNDFTGTYADDSFWNGLLSPASDYYWNLSVSGNKILASVDPNAVPEPSTWALLLLGAAGLLYWRKRK